MTVSNMIRDRFYVAGASIGTLTGAFKIGLVNLGFAGTSNGDTPGKRVWYTCSKISPRQDT